MRRSPIGWLVAGGLMLVGCGGSVRAIDDDGPCAAFLGGGGGACAEVTWLGEDRLDVVLSLNPAGVPGAADAPVDLRWRAKYLGADYAVRAVSMADGQGWPKPAPLTERRVIRYRVTLDRALHGTYGRGGVSFAAPGGWQLMGRSFVPDIWIGERSVAVPARLVFDPGPSALLTARGPEARVFDAPSLITLADSSFAVGSWTLRQRALGRTTLYAASGDPDAGPALEGYLAVIARVLAAIEPALGPLPTGRLLAMHHVLPDGDWGTTTASTSIQSSPQIPRYLSDQAAEVLVHELLHFWMPGEFVVRDLWMSEGLTDYLTVVMLARLDGAEPLRTARVVQRSHRAYAAEAGERTLADAERGRWAYDAGLVAGYCLDTHLTAASDTSLPAVLGALLRTHPGEALTADDLEAAIRAHSPGSAELMTELRQTRGPIDLAPCLFHAGFDMRTVERTLPTPKAAVVDIMGLHGLSTSGKTESFVVSKAAPGSAFVPGDRIRTVAGHPVSTPDSLALALGGIGEGQPFAVELMRGGASKAVELTMPALAADAKATRLIKVVVPSLEPAAPGAPVR